MQIRKKRIGIVEILNSTGVAAKVLGNKDHCISNASPIDKADSTSISFCNKRSEEGAHIVRTSQAGIVICYEGLSFTTKDYQEKTIILVSNPRLAMSRVLKRYFQTEMKYGIAATAVIEPRAKIHPNTYIGPHCYIGRCKIDEGTVIHGNTYIYSNSEIGKNVTVQAGAVIGAEGAGFERNSNNLLEKFPQIGGVIIADGVEIGANTCVMRGALSNTIVGTGTKIGNLCYIGHGVIIGNHCLILQNSVLGGSSRIGDYSQVSLSACIRNKIEIGNNVMVGMGSVVTKNVSDGKTVFGVPAKEQN